jgi:hypothetical protein
MWGTLGNCDEEGRQHFFLKKEAKTFANCGGSCGSSHLKEQKFFGSFFQKRTLP